MKNEGIYASELSTSRHIFQRYHFCRGNTSKRKTRIGLILRGRGSYIYLGKRLSVAAGDAVFIPENIFCYSEWHGEPEIEVVYISCFLHYDGTRYEPLKLPCDEETRSLVLTINRHLTGEDRDTLLAYSLFYKLLSLLLPKMKESNAVYDKVLQTAIEYITANFQHHFSVGEIAKQCCVSESTLYHLFQKELGETPVGFLNSIRINVAIEYLENRNRSVSEISRLVGFRSENHFRKVFRSVTGTTPLHYKRGGK